MSETPVKNKDIDYTKHINVSSPIPEVTSVDQIILLQKILSELQKIKDTSLTTYHITYFMDTLITTKQKIDIISDSGGYATGLIVLDKGGGFNININNETQSIPVHNGMQIINEKIEQIYWTGTGTSGTAKIRIGAIK